MSEVDQRKMARFVTPYQIRAYLSSHSPWANEYPSNHACNFLHECRTGPTFGRTGDFFASSVLGANAAMIALAKSISGIGVPGTGALLLPHELCLLDSGESSLTWGGSNLVSAAIVATIKEMRSPSFFEHTKVAGDHLNEGLEAICASFECVGCVRGLGLMSGIEIVRSKESREPNPRLASAIVEESRNVGLLLRQSLYGRGSFVKVRPALTITINEVDELLSRLRFALKRVCNGKE